MESGLEEMLKQETKPMQKEMTENTAFCSVLQSNIDADIRENEPKTSSFFGTPSLFVGLNPKVLSECDSAISPTSPLDFRLFWGAGNSAVRSPMPIVEGHRKSPDWDYSKVGLSIIGSIDDEDRNIPARILRSSDNMNFPLGSQNRTDDTSFMVNSEAFEKPKVVFEIGSNPPETDSGKIQLNSLYNWSASPKSSCLITKLMRAGPGNGILGCSPAYDKTVSLEFACETSHGPVPNTTQTYGDRILGCHYNKHCSFADKVGGEYLVLKNPASYPYIDLSFCHACYKPLDDGKDIYMYRGEKAFCSPECREKEILFDEGTEKANSSKSELESEQGKGVLTEASWVT